MAAAGVAVVKGRWVAGAHIAGALVLQQPEDEGRGCVGVGVEGDHREVVAAAAKCDIEKVNSMPVVASAHQNSVEKGCEIVVGGYPKLGDHLWTVHSEKTLKDHSEVVGP